jgi:hypothetical protein
MTKGSAKGDTPEQAAFKSQVAAMAAGPEIQAELQRVDREFGVTEADGLEFE